MSPSLWFSQQRLASIVILLAVFMTNLDLWIVNVALPAIGSSFASSSGGAATLSSLSWVLNAYAIALAALLVVAGRLGDRIGQRPVFLAGVTVFTLASLGCALAPDLITLVAARALQAVGAAAQLPTSLALLLASVPAGQRTRATRNWAAVGGLAAAAGPVAGGLLVQVDWRWVFVINVPIGIATVVAGLRVLPSTARTEKGRLPDLTGALLITLAIAALSGALVQAPDWGWLDARSLALFALALAGAAVFVRRSLRHSHPLFELPLLRLPQFGAASAGTFAFGIAFAIMLLSNVLWCQEIWHWSALRTGVAMVPGPALVPVVTVLTARSAQRLGHGPLVATGGLLFAAAMLWRTCFASLDADYWLDLLPSQVLGGVGVGLTLGTLVAAGVSSLPGHRAATGSALVNSVRQMSATVGVALLVAIVGTHVGPAQRQDFRVAWVVAAALSVATAVVGVRLTRTATRARGAATPVEAPAAAPLTEPR
ncbi:MFS transporter [Streptomyces longwoodensis]|uniref:MFS transporter n=1 Tax=Streptomyces longwoodensis TaxID=68231 RepID=A0A101R5H6_9ACTN|nr:MFS transporter [Streptomyces longwoodensis]KUN42002.1 MFS transporter [Streptomyces longwoodensis]